MDDILIFIPHGSRNPRIAQHLDAEILASYVRRSGFQASVLDGAVSGLSPQGFYNWLQRTAVRVIYWHLPSRREYRGLCEAGARTGLKNSRTRACIAGGEFAGLHDAELLDQHPHLDGVVRSELELPVQTLLIDLREDKPWHRCPGLTVRGPEGPVRNPAPHEPLDLGLLPAAAEDLLHPKRRELGQKILFNRGCKSRCQYCGVPTLLRPGLPGSQKLWRTRSARAIADEIELYVRRHGISRFVFTATVFFGYDARGTAVVEEVAEEILRRKLDITFKIMTHPHHLVRNQRLLPLLKKAGLDLVVVGLDSGSEAALKRYRVEFGPSDSFEALRLLHAQRLVFTPSLIFYEPYMTLQDIREQLRYLRRTQPFFTHMEPTYPYFLDRHLLRKSLRVYSGMPLAESLRRDGLITKQETLEAPPRVRFKEPEVARFFRLHRRVYRRYLRPLRPLLWDRRCTDSYPRLNLLPLDLFDHLLDRISTARSVSENKTLAEAGAWLGEALGEDSLEKMATGGTDEATRTSLRHIVATSLTGATNS